MKNKFLLFLLLISTASFAQMSGPSWIKSELRNSEVFDSPLYEFTNKYDQYKSHENISGLLIKGLDYLGKPTQFFAWYGVPTSLKEGQKAPAVICVHGGGGTAFEAWVKKWNNRGYIAISMSLEGNVPGARDENNKHPKFEFSGPQRDGFFKDADKNLQDQWFYHAVADVILTNSLLRNPKFSNQIDTSHIGITGISWGGILTNVITGIDNRYHFAIPVYGCGYLDEAPLYVQQLSNNNSKQQHFYLENWEPSLYVPSQTQATLHVNGTNDKHFSLNSFTKTYSATQSEKYLRIELNMKHGHQAGWMPEDIYQFADYMTKTGNKRAAFVSEDLDANNQLSYKYEYEGRLVRAYLYYTKDTADWSQSGYSWTEQEATVSYEEKKIITTLPSDAVAYFVNAISTDGLIFSSPMKTGNYNTIKTQESTSDRSKYYPEFSWETVPVAFHFGKTSALMTEEEAKFVASKSNFICLEKAHALDQLGSTEEGIEQEARQLKKYNPKMKVIFYWNTFLDYSMFNAHKVYEQHPEWWLKTQDGKLDLKNGKLKRYDLSNHEVRAWWTDVAQKAVIEGSSDGVFMDAFPQILSKNNKSLWGNEKYDAIQQGLKDIIKETREKIGDEKLIVYNGIRSTPQIQMGYDYPDNTDAIMIEHFGHFNSGTKESMLLDIREMEKAGKAGKIVVFKGWPGFAWIDKDAMKKPLDQKQKIAEENIEFPLAAFLVGAQKNCYFIYNWGYRMQMGCLEWYPEFDKKLGKPLADATQSGWSLSREFEYASVWVNLETKTANINWKEE